MRTETTTRIIYEAGDRVKVVKAPDGIGNAHLLGMLGRVRADNSPNSAYLRIDMDGDFVATLDPDEIEFVKREPEALLLRCSRCGLPAGSSIHSVDAQAAEIRMAAHRFVSRRNELERLAKKAAHKVMEDLNDRKGYRMDDVDDETKGNYILQSLAEGNPPVCFDFDEGFFLRGFGGFCFDSGR